MAKSAKSKRAQTIKTLSIQPNTPRGQAVVTPRAVPMNVESVRSAQRNGMHPAAEVVTTSAGTVTAEEELMVSRKDEIEALPMFKHQGGDGSRSRRRGHHPVCGAAALFARGQGVLL